MKFLIKIGKIVLTAIVIATLFWVAYLFRFNLGKLLNKIWKREVSGKQPRVIGIDGKEVGITAEIVKSKDPLRDKTILKLDNGVLIKLPDGIVDSDVDSVILERPGVYDVKIKHNRLTDIFSN